MLGRLLQRTPSSLVTRRCSLPGRAVSCLMSSESPPPVVAEEKKEEQVTIPYLKQLVEPLAEGVEMRAEMFEPYYRENVVRASQNFEPVPLSESDSSATSTSEYQQRADESFSGVEYLKLPIVRVVAAWNNTKIYVYPPDRTGNKFYSQITSGMLGFKGGKKKTEYAGEETGREAAIKALERGCHTHVRVCLKGIGPGRRAAVRGLVLGGFTVVSLSDESPLHLYPELPQRPRKIRRI